MSTWEVGNSDLRVGEYTWTPVKPGTRFWELREVGLMSLDMKKYVMKDKNMYLLCAQISHFVVYLGCTL